MNDFFYKKRIAVPVFIIMVLFSIFVLGGRDLRKEANKALDVFYGDNEYDIDISQECENIIANGKNLLVIANKYLDKDDAGIRTLTNYANEIISGNRFERADGLAHGAVMIQRTKDDVLVRLFTMDITEKDREYLIKIEADIDASLRKAKLSGYSEYEAEFHELRVNPYTNFIARVNRIKYLPMLNFR